MITGVNLGAEYLFSQISVNKKNKFQSQPQVYSSVSLENSSPLWRAYSKISFGRSEEEHKSWGASFVEDYNFKQFLKNAPKQRSVLLNQEGEAVEPQEYEYPYAYNKKTNTGGFFDPKSQKYIKNKNYLEELEKYERGFQGDASFKTFVYPNRDDNMGLPITSKVFVEIYESEPSLSLGENNKQRQTDLKAAYDEYRTLQKRGIEVSIEQMNAREIVKTVAKRIDSVIHHDGSRIADSSLVSENSKEIIMNNLNASLGVQSDDIKKHLKSFLFLNEKNIKRMREGKSYIYSQQEAQIFKNLESLYKQLHEYPGLTSTQKKNLVAQKLLNEGISEARTEILSNAIYKKDLVSKMDYVEKLVKEKEKRGQLPKDAMTLIEREQIEAIHDQYINVVKLADGKIVIVPMESEQKLSVMKKKAENMGMSPEQIEKIFVLPDEKIKVKNLENAKELGYDKQELAKLYKQFVEYRNIEARGTALVEDNGRLVRASIDGKSRIVELVPSKDDPSVFQTKSPVKNVKNFSFYRFIRIDKNDNKGFSIYDMYADKQPFVTGWSQIYKSAYDYKTKDFEALDVQRTVKGKKIPAKISRLGGPDNPKAKGVDSLRIYEINIPSFAKEGDFNAAKEKVTRIAAMNLANTIEIMPLDTTYSKGWSYDGVHKLAINEKNGSPNELKEFIDYCKSLKLNVMVDIVPNHLGPDGNFTSKAAPMIKDDNNKRWGDQYDYEGVYYKNVGDYMANVALKWAREYKVDGIRMDMTNAMGSDFALKKLTREMNAHFPDVFLIAEDARERCEVSNRLTQRRSNDSLNHINDINNLDNQVENLRQGRIENVGNIGLDSQWSFEFVHAVEDAVHGASDDKVDHNGNPIKGREMDHLEDAILHAVGNRRTKFMSSHDEAGNNDGSSPITRFFARNLYIYGRVNPDVVEKANKLPQDVKNARFGDDGRRNGQAGNQVAQKLLEALVSGKVDKMNDEEYYEFLKETGVSDSGYISKKELKDGYERAFAELKISMATVYSLPGPKMLFQGDDTASIDLFKFFRNFTDNMYGKKEDQSRIMIEKGYDPSVNKALADSNRERIQLNKNAKDKQEQYLRYFKDLNDLVDLNEELQSGKLGEIRSVDNEKGIHSTYVSKDSQAIYTVKNFRDSAHYGDLVIHFPPGKWKQVLNSDAKKYGGSGNFDNGERVFQGEENISISQFGAVFFKRID